jgi:parallel beta-helix repeat protein
MRRLVVIAVGLGVVTCTGCAAGFTGDPQVVSDHDARLAGYVGSSGGGEVEYWFQYGATTAYGSTSAHQTIATVARQPKAVTATISGLDRSTSYHYRLCAQDSQQGGGPGCGEDRLLKTQSFGCGETITTDVTFTADMVCGQFDAGMVIGAAGVDVDLAGHTFSSSFQVQDEFDPLPHAIVDDGGYDDLTVRNGHLYAWGTGVDVTGGARTRVLDLTHLGRTTINHAPPGPGVVLAHADDSEIRHVLAIGGLFTSDSARVTIADSTVQGQGLGLYRTDDSTVTRNVVNDTDAHAFRGIRVFGAHNRIEDNAVSTYFVGISIDGGTGNQVVGNEVFRNQGNSGPEDGFGDGIFVDAFTNETLVKDNYAHDNRDDGIQVKGIGTTVTGNRADHNAAWGINAVPGVTDGGGNTATGNGQAAQCRNVFCS